MRLPSKATSPPTCAVVFAGIEIKRAEPNAAPCHPQTDMAVFAAGAADVLSQWPLANEQTSPPPASVPDCLEPAGRARMGLAMMLRRRQRNHSKRPAALPKRMKSMCTSQGVHVKTRRLDSAPRDTAPVGGVDYTVPGAPGTLRREYQYHSDDVDTGIKLDRVGMD